MERSRPSSSGMCFLGYSRVCRRNTGGAACHALVHDKASYFVAPRRQCPASSFADALHGAKLQSWVGDADADCSWLAGRLGDVYPHETVISHIRRGLEQRFPRSTPGETRARFAPRMSKVQEYINSCDFSAKDGGGLDALAKSIHERCRRVSLRK